MWSKGRQEEEERGLCDLCGMQRGNIMEEREGEETDLFVVSQSAFKRERMTGEAFNHV